MKVFIIHGSFGNPEGNWFPWLKKELEIVGHEVYVPQFPIEDYEEFARQVENNPKITPENQTVDNWMQAFEPYMEKIDIETVFVAHSLGPAFVLKILEKIQKKVRACVFVSGFIGELPGNPVYNAANSTFFKTPINWNKIKSLSDSYYLLASDNDPYVPSQFLRGFAEKLGVKLKIVSGGKHLNAEAGYVKFPRILDIIKSTKYLKA